MDMKRAIGLGIAVGILFGVVLHGYVLGLVIGIAFGVALCAYGKWRRGPVPPATEDEPQV